MFNTVILGGQNITLDPKKAIGKGGEADIYEVLGKALKVYKSPDHPDYQHDPKEQQGARDRLLTQQKKLPLFPKNLPASVVCPLELALDPRSRQIVGYTMPLIKGAEVLLRYADKGFRQAGVSNDDMLAILKNLHKTVKGVHDRQVVIGDFNDLNVLVKDNEAFLVDVDSFQFGSFPCRVFTARFVDPLLCDPNKSSPILFKPHTDKSDWYAFAVMLMQSLLFVDPYGGVYIPKNKTNRMPHPARPLHRITVFHPEVRYPKPAVPCGVLPDDLLDFFHRTFVSDERGEFPLKLLEMRWTKCSNCQTQHSRAKCPTCNAHGLVKQVQTIKGAVVATHVFKTPGLIVYACAQEGKLLYLYHENGRYMREDGRAVVIGTLNPQMRFRIRAKSTLLGQNNQVIVLSPDLPPERVSVDSVGQLPIFDANGENYFWLQQGSLYRDSQFAPEYIGDTLQGQTLFWVGPKFGFGLYRAGGLSVAFVFPAKGAGINDSVSLSPIKGQLVDATCVFTDTRCFFLLSTRQGGKTVNECTVIRSDGSVEATASAEAGDGSWLGTIRGKVALGNFLLTATDEGIVRTDIDSGQLSLSREFKDTEPFVDSGTQLFPGNGGVYAVSSNQVTLLKIV